MGKSVLDLVIKLAKEGDADKAVVSGLTQVKQGMGEAMVVAGAMAAAGAVLEQVYQKTVVVFENYATQVRDISRETGMSAEESSRMIQAGDDLGVKYENLKKSLEEMAKRGQEPTIANLEKMADQYVKLAPGVERAKYLTDNFGKSGQEMGKFLEQGSAGVRKYTDAVDANLVLTQKQLNEARQLHVVQDQLNDQYQGLAINVGSKLTPYIAAWVALIGKATSGTVDWTNAIKLLINPIGTIAELTVNYGKTFNELQSQAGGATDALNEHSDAVKQNAEEQKAAIETNKSVIDLTMQLQSAQDGHAKKVAEVREKLAELNQEYNAGTVSEDEYKAKKKELTGELDKEAKSFEEASKRIVFSLLQQRLATEGMTDKNMKLLLSVGEGMGLIDSKTATVAKNLNDNIGKLDTAKPDEFKKIMQDIFGLPDEKAQKITLENFDNPDLAATADNLQNINALPDTIKKTLELNVVYTGDGKPPDVTPPTTPPKNKPTTVPQSSSGPPASSAGELSGSSSGPQVTGQSTGGSGTTIIIQNLNVTLSKGMTADEFEKMLLKGRG